MYIALGFNQVGQFSQCCYRMTVVNFDLFCELFKFFVMHRLHIGCLKYYTSFVYQCHLIIELKKVQDVF